MFAATYDFKAIIHLKIMILLLYSQSLLSSIIFLNAKWDVLQNFELPFSLQQKWADLLKI